MIGIGNIGEREKECVVVEANGIGVLNLGYLLVYGPVGMKLENGTTESVSIPRGCGLDLVVILGMWGLRFKSRSTAPTSRL